MNESEPLLKYRNLDRRCQNWGVINTLGLVQGKPVYCLNGIRYEGGMIFTLALLRNVGTFALMLRKNPKWVAPMKGKSTDAGKGADQFVVVMKSINLDGAKGLGCLTLRTESTMATLDEVRYNLANSKQCGNIGGVL